MIPALMPSVWIVFEGKTRYVCFWKRASMLLWTASVSSSMRNVLYLLGVAIAGNDTVVHALQKASCLPRRGTTLRVTTQALLRHDRDGVARSTVEGREDGVPDVRLVLLLQRNE